MLTDMSIRGLKPPEKGTVTLWDKTVSGLGLRCSQGATKTFIVMLRKTRSRVSIGHYPQWTLKDARTRAIEIIAERQNKPAPKRISFETAFEHFKTTHTSKKRESTRTETERLLKSHFLPRLKTRAMGDISTNELTEITDKLALETPGTAIHAFAAARLMFRWAVNRRLIDRSPLDGVPLPAEIRFRERVLSVNELCTVWRACEAVNGQFGPLVKLLLLTGQRRSQIAELHADYIDYDERTITWAAEAMKGKKPHTIPYSDLTAAILETLPKEGLLFPARSRETPFNGFSKSKPRLDKKLPEGFEPFVLHDLRRGLASAWQSLGIPIEQTERMLAHISGSFAGIVSVYQKHSYLPELKIAVEKWENHLRDTLSQVTD